MRNRMTKFITNKLFNICYNHLSREFITPLWLDTEPEVADFSTNFLQLL